MANRVRSHTRRTASGGTSRVSQHNRAGRGRKGDPPLSYGHGLDLLRRAHRAGKRKKKLLAGVLGVLGAGEIAGMFTLDTVRVMALTGAVVAIGVATVTSLMTGRT